MTRLSRPKLPVLSSADTMERPDNPSRRNFMGALGASVLAAGAGACIRKPKELILPYAQRPEDLVPGKPRYFATTVSQGPSVLGVLVESHEGRPTKVEGNPQHPMSNGGTTAWAQAMVLDLYAPSRSRTARLRGESASPPVLAEKLAALSQSILQNRGEGFGVLVDATPSPTLNRLLRQLQAECPKAEIYRHDPLDDENSRKGAEMVGAAGVRLSDGEAPQVVVALDADILGTSGDSVRASRHFADGRRDPRAPMNRLYVVESGLTLTGAAADHRLSLPAHRIAGFLTELVRQLDAKGRSAGGFPARGPDLGDDAGRVVAFASAVAQDLAARPRGETRIVVGERQPAHVHALALLANQALGNVGRSLRLVRHDFPDAGDLAELSKAILLGRIQRLVILAGNPAYTAPGDLEMPALVKQVPLSIHLGDAADETGTLASWHIPKTHDLEAWGDRIGSDGTMSIQQPLIAPMFDSMSSIELLARLLGSTESAYALVRETHRGRARGSFERAWKRWLHDGVIKTDAAQEFGGRLEAPRLASAFEGAPSFGGLEVNYVIDPTILDGRFGDNPWLQELPDPITRLTWDNAALISPQTAAALGVETGDMVRVGVEGREIDIAAFVQPGIARGVVTLPLGYGRRVGRFASAGFDVGGIRAWSTRHLALGGAVKPGGRRYTLASTQPVTNLRGRPHIRQATQSEFLADPRFVKRSELIDEKHIHSAWKEPALTGQHQWGMVIDLNTCMGCGTCTIACQAENNISWVGKEEVLLGREMHWIRIDRYHEGDGDDLEFVSQPVSCAQCETAPCENVCPVGATAHSPEGLNDMAYNRCIGTRYCANNCPYKIRRFNFFNYAKRNDADFEQRTALQRNPDVTVRFRGVMEKCTYCVQRISKARIEAKVHGNGTIPDGTVVPACAQACPTQAIVFGNISDAQSEVSRQRNDPRNYEILAELNIRPRTTYLAALKNPNPNLGGGRDG